MDLTATKDCHCLAARRRARDITRLYEEKLRPHGLRATQFSVLATLAQTGPTPLGELADLLGLERTTLTRSANRLEDEGWIAEADAGDARVRKLELTPAGREKVESAYPAWKEAQAEVAGRLGRPERSETTPGDTTMSKTKEQTERGTQPPPTGSSTTGGE